MVHIVIKHNSWQGVFVKHIVTTQTPVAVSYNKGTDEFLVCDGNGIMQAIKCKLIL